MNDKVLLALADLMNDSVGAALEDAQAQNDAARADALLDLLRAVDRLQSTLDPGLSRAV